MVPYGIDLELELHGARFLKKCSHLRDKGGLLMLRKPIEFVLTRTVSCLNLCTAYTAAKQQASNKEYLAE